MSIFITMTPWHLISSNNHKALFLNICSTLSRRPQAWTRNFRLTACPYQLVSSNWCPKLSGLYLLTLQGEGNRGSWLVPSLASVSLSDARLPSCLQRTSLLQCFAQARQTGLAAHQRRMYLPPAAPGMPLTLICASLYSAQASKCFQGDTCKDVLRLLGDWITHRKFWQLSHLPQLVLAGRLL